MPPSRVFKVNADISTFAEEDAFGVVAIIRDCSGRFVATMLKKFWGLTDA